jgi:hypothetical protein
MIKNKNNHMPEHFGYWGAFKEDSPIAFDFIEKYFQNLVRSSNTIYGNTTLKNLLREILPHKFPELITQFQEKFPIGIDSVLGIGLWITIDADNEEWWYTDTIDEGGMFKTKVYARSK